jgi:hypothetical protein
MPACDPSAARASRSSTSACRAGYCLRERAQGGFVDVEFSTSKAIYDQQVFVNFVENPNLVIQTMTPASMGCTASLLPPSFTRGRIR